ncbi:type VII secretion-associated serine protease mycosin [Streptomyces cucumeris]|uniref:type VII secretion-associated serine protease mycosin n=1 Tax=Streptomyces cucumeris TaxID=2962890 RepID=UPI003D71CCB5
MQAERMWKVSKGKGVTVAVLDTGVNASLPELRGQLLKGTDASHQGSDPHKDPDGHGSNMAGIIAGTGAGGGLQGLAPEAKILPIQVNKIDARQDSYASVMSKAIRYAVDHDARVLNISQAAQGDPADFTKIQSAVNYALRKGRLVFAGVGNDGDKSNSPSYPASLSGVVGVGAIDRNGRHSKFSTIGDSVGLVALGQDIAEHCTKSAGTCKGQGTSQATAIASASAALIWAKHPKWTNNQVLRVLMQTAAKPKTGDIPSSYVGYGSVRPRKVLLDGEGDPGPANTNPLLAREGATKPNPSPSASKSSDAGSQQQPPGSDSGKQGEQDAQKSDKETKASDGDNGGNTTLWIALGAGAAVVVGGAAAFVVLRRRNGTL